MGQLRRPHGVRGEIRLSVWTDFPERLAPGNTIYAGKSHDLLQIRSVRQHRDDLLVAFDAYTTREQVAELTNQVLYVKSADLPPLPEGEIYLYQLLGLTVINVEDESNLGEVVEIIETGANDVLLVRQENGSDLLLPDIDSVILSINLAKNEIRVRLLPGLVP